MDHAETAGDPFEEPPASPPPKHYSRIRRWSLDILPKRLLSSKRGSVPVLGTEMTDPDPPPLPVPKNGRRHSNPAIKVPPKVQQQQQHRGFFQHHHRKKETFMLLDLEGGDTVVVTCEDEHHLKALLLHAMMDQRVRSYRMIVASTRAVMKMDSGLSRRAKSCEFLLDVGDEDDQEDKPQPDAGETDHRHELVSELLNQERRFCDNLQSLFECYAEPLRKFSSLTKEDHELLFTTVEPLLSLSASLVTKLETALATWNSDTTKIGNLFSSKFWNHYQDYYRGYCTAKSFLLEKHQTDSAFDEFCELQQRQGRLSLDALLALPVKRIPDYDKYLSGLLETTSPEHVDYEDLSKAAKRVHSMVKEREVELSEVDNQVAMEAVQDRFPHDDLQLRTNNINNNNDINSINNNNHEDKEKTSNKSRGLAIRRRSAPSAVLFKSLSGTKSKSSTSLWANAGMGKKDHDVITQFKMAEADSSRMFIMEGHVQLATGMQIQERYLFLFSDLLLVAKQKSSTAFKLKHRVQLCDMWIASCIEEVSETTRPTERSFVIGWPTTNVVATFQRPEVKDEWLFKLSERITEEKLKDEGKTLQLKVSHRDMESSTSHSCQMTINNITQAKDVMLTCLGQMKIPESEAKDYQLWVLSGKEGSPYPLIGHETPFSIKLSHVRGLTRSRSRDDVDNMTAGDLDTVVEDSAQPGHKCEFYLKQKKTPKKHHLEDSSYQKSMKKQKKSQNIFNTLLRRIRPNQPTVFGLPLADICDENSDPPEPIIKLMVLVYNQGPTINGILRRGNNASLGKDIREKIDSGAKYNVEDHQAPTAASVFKEFLRCIPDRLLLTELHEEWIAIKKDDPEEERIEKIKTALAKLPPPHYRLVKLTICLLQHLAKHSGHTKMGPSNLATCIAPSFYPPDGAGSHLGKHSNNIQKQMQMKNSVYEITDVFTPLISFMISKHIEIFGEDILSMFVKYGCEVSPTEGLDEERQNHASAEEDEEEEEMMEEEEEEDEEDDEAFSGQRKQKRHRLPLQQHQRQHHMQRDSNSGTDSDSMHSVLSMTDASIGCRRNDSSMDSLVDREYYPNETESSPKATKSHLSPSNLSRDSGLTLSDTQLYEEDVCHTDGAGNMMKLYQRSASHFVDRHDMDDAEYYGRFDRRRVDPVPPPRNKGGRRGRDSNEESDSEQHGFTTVHPQRPPFKHSASTTQLDIHSKKGKGGELRPMLTHPPLNKRISSDSIGEEDEIPEETHPVDFQRMRNSTDIGTLVKSASGAHLILSEDLQPTKYDMGPRGRNANHHFMRQASVTDSTPPVSPQSRYSQSSRDSVISDSTYSASRDGSGYSAPQTPDEPLTKSLSWMPDTNPPGKQWDGRLAHNLNNPSAHSLSKSTSDLLSDSVDGPESYFMAQSSASPEEREIFYTEKHLQKYKPTLSRLRCGKAHEAEEVDTRHRPHFSLMSSSEDNSADTSSPQSSTTFSPPPHKIHGLPAHLVKGSPPPNVILQSLQSPPLRRDSAPMKASYASVSQVRRSSMDSIEPKSYDVSKSMSAINPDDYLTVKSKPIMISSSENSSPSSGSSASTILPKYASSNTDLLYSSKDRDLVLSDLKRPQKPPNYQQALQRNFMIKHSVPIDITVDDTEKQKEISARARELYEKSVQIYHEQRCTKSSEPTTTQSTVSSNCEAIYSEKSDMDPSVIRDSGSRGNMQYGSAHSDYVSQDNRQVQLTQDSPDDSGASGFLDMGSISHSFQEDVLHRRNARAGSDVSSVSQTVSAASSVTVSRNDSKLSDTGSSSGSSITVSTLSRHSDSFGRRSDLSNTSNITVSSVTSSDSSSDTNSVMSKRKSTSDFEQRNMSYSRHFRPVEPDNSQFEQENDKVSEEEEVEDVYVTLKKNPQQLYLESKEMFEQSSLSGLPSSSSSSLSISQSKPSLMTSSSFSTSNIQQQTTSAFSNSPPRSTSVHAIPSENPNSVSSFRCRPLRAVHGSTLAVPTSSLQRSRSDSAEHLNKLGTYSPRSVNTLASAGEEKTEKESVKPPKSKSPPSDIKSELHQKFLSAKSYFYNPEDDQNASPAVSPRLTPQPTQPSTSSSVYPSRQSPRSRWASHRAASYVEDASVTSTVSQQTKSSVPSKSSNKQTNEIKKELPWSVKELKSLFSDQQESSKNTATFRRGNGSSNSNTEGMTCENRPRNPPPYQNPPPFRRQQESIRNSTSSTSSGGSDHSSSVANKSSSKSVTPNRYGPQSLMYDSFGSHSSSEEGYSSSLDRKSICSSGSNTDSEAISNRANITYV